MTSKEKVKKLQIYLEKCKNNEIKAANPHKKAFFAREIFKTNLAIQKLIV